RIGKQKEESAKCALWIRRPFREDTISRICNTCPVYGYEGLSEKRKRKAESATCALGVDLID
ncbi:hypothetical protein ACJMK2_038158, partial [Sinanodonta woodiana]